MKIEGSFDKTNVYISPQLYNFRKTDQSSTSVRQADKFSPGNASPGKKQNDILDSKTGLALKRTDLKETPSHKDEGPTEINKYVSSIENFINEIDTHDISVKSQKEVESGLRQIIKDAGDIQEGLQTKEVFHGKDNLKCALKSTADRIAGLRNQEGGITDADVERMGLNSPVPNFGEVKKGILYRGAQPSRTSLHWLAKKGIKTIVNFREVGREDEYGYSDFNRQEEKRLCKQLGIKYVEINIKDRALPTQEDVYKFLDNFDSKSTRPVFIHCAAGVGRTGIMAGLFHTNIDGWKASNAIKEAGKFGLQPDVKPDHKIQAEFVRANETLPPRNPVFKAFAENKGIIQKHTLHDTSLMWGNINESAAFGHSYEIDGNYVNIGGKTYFVNAHDPEAYKAHGEPFPAKNPEDLHPAPLIKFAKEKGVFIKFDFKTPLVIDEFTKLGKDIPFHRKMGHAFVKELEMEGTELKPFQTKEQLSLEDVARAKELLGGAPFQVSCRGVTLKNLDHKQVDRIAEKVKGIAEIVNFNLPKGQKTPLHIVKYMWKKYGITTEIKINSPKDREFWEKAGIPYFGSSDKNEYATPFT
ncbi:MAG: tyrosine-protein phosphatase [Candidatus Eremiobacteraeota bacterium]|nr:tyrosine-protein phosphatase [Candidatus Eremiobacteraeota bacterium]